MLLWLRQIFINRKPNNELIGYVKDHDNVWNKNHHYIHLTTSYEVRCVSKQSYYNIIDQIDDLNDEKQLHQLDKPLLLIDTIYFCDMDVLHHVNESVS